MDDAVVEVDFVDEDDVEVDFVEDEEVVDPPPFAAVVEVDFVDEDEVVVDFVVVVAAPFAVVADDPDPPCGWKGREKRKKKKKS